MGGRGASSGVKDKKGVSSVDISRGTSKLATFEISDTVIHGADEASLKRLAEMAKFGEIPSRIEGNREERARIYEEINRLYSAPPGVMGQYHIDDYGGSIQVRMDYGFLVGEDPRSINLPHGRKAGEAERAGAIKYAIYKHRGALELAATCRAEGYPTYDMHRKWGGRILSSSEKAQVDREIEAHVQNLFQSPMSKSGKAYNVSEWAQLQGGWVRKGDSYSSYSRNLRDGIEREIAERKRGR